MTFVRVSPLQEQCCSMLTIRAGFDVGLSASLDREIRKMTNWQHHYGQLSARYMRARIGSGLGCVVLGQGWA